MAGIFNESNGGSGQVEQEGSFSEAGSPASAPPVSPKIRVLRALNRALLKGVKLVEPSCELFSKPKGVDRSVFCWRGQPVDRTIIYLRSDLGCAFARKTGGCAACRHSIMGTAGQRVPLENLYVRQYEAAVQVRGLTPVVCIYNEGNVLNNDELPFEQLLCIVRHLAAHDVKRLIIESRAEYINDRVLAPLAQAAGQMEVEVGIGLESRDEFVRNELFLKEITLKAYERAIRCLHGNNILSLAYVVIKPPFLNEAQGIADAVATAIYAFEAGTGAVSLEPIGVEPYTVTELLHNEGLFTPPWLWSVLKVTNCVHSLGEVRLGGFSFHPMPKEMPRNCKDCTDRVLEAIALYNRTYDLSLLNSLSCRCSQDYKRELGELKGEIDEEALYAELVHFVSRHSYLLSELN
jgi:archaeosine synthase beta-subunit